MQRALWNSMRRTFNTVHDTYLGKVTFENVEMYYRQEKLLDVLKQEYDYFVYDFGTYMDTDFSKTSFLEKDVRIFVVGSKASEMSYTNELIRNEYYTDVNYVFNFISEKEKPELLEYMEEKAAQTYFTVSTPDQFEYVPNEAFEKLLPVEDISEPEEEPRGFFRRKRKEETRKSKERQERGNGMGKFKKTLVSAAKADLAQEQEQKRLRKKHHVEEEGLLIVERDNLLKFFVRCLASMVRIGATIFLFYWPPSDWFHWFIRKSGRYCSGYCTRSGRSFSRCSDNRERGTTMDVGNLCVMGGACIIGIAIFYKVWIAENRFDVFTDKYKTYQYDLMIRCGEQEEPVKVTMYSDARYSDPWLLFQGYQRGRTVKGTLTIRTQEQIWSCPVHAISSITMTVSKRGEGVT